MLPPTAAGAGTAAEALRSGMAAMQPEQQFSDFTTATALERFIATLETCLTTWRDRGAAAPKRFDYRRNRLVMLPVAHKYAACLTSATVTSRRA